MNTVKLLIAIIATAVFMSCEDLPCRKSMMNPTLGFSLLENESTGTTNTSVKANINSILVDDVNYNYGGFQFSKFRVPLDPNKQECNIRIQYSSVLRINPITKILQGEYIDTIMPDEDLNYENVIFSDTLRIDSLCYFDTVLNKEICSDTSLLRIHTMYSDTIENYPDSSYISNFSQSFKAFYKVNLVPVSPECGFIYEYDLDSIVPLERNYLDTFTIDSKNIAIPKDLYENEPYHINLYF